MTQSELKDLSEERESKWKREKIVGGCQERQRATNEEGFKKEDQPNFNWSFLELIVNDTLLFLMAISLFIQGHLYYIF